MTEHSKIPLPDEGAKGKSLFERAEGAFGLGGLKAAPVPAQLADPVNRRPAKVAARPGPDVAPAQAAPVTAVPPPAVAVPGPGLPGSAGG